MLEHIIDHSGTVTLHTCDVCVSPERLIDMYGQLIHEVQQFIAAGSPGFTAPSDPPHSCAWCPDAVRGLYAVAYNAVLAYDMARAGHGDMGRYHRKMAELRELVMNVYSPQVNAHFDALGRGGE